MGRGLSPHPSQTVYSIKWFAMGVMSHSEWRNYLAQSKVFWKITGYPKPVGVKPYYLSEDEAIDACPIGAWVERYCPKQGRVDVGWKSERNNGRFEYV